MTKIGVARITISLPHNLLEQFDSVIKGIGQDRSKALQQAIRDFITEYQWEHISTISAVGTITLIYDHDVNGLEAKLNDVQHQHSEIIASTTHIHLDSHHCLLVIVMNGGAEEIRELFTEIRGLRGVHQIKLTSLMGA